MHGQIGQNFAVHLDAGECQAVDEFRVAQIRIDDAHRSVDPLDPQGAEVALAGLTVAGGVLVGLVDRLGGGAEVARARGVIAFRLFQHLLVRGVGDFTGFNARHGSELRSAVVGHVFLHDLRIRFAQHHGASGVADEFRGAFDHAVALTCVTDFDLAGGGELEPLLGCGFRLHLGHLQLLFRVWIRDSACHFGRTRGVRAGLIDGRAVRKG